MVAHHLVQMTKTIFTEFGGAENIISDGGMNLKSETSRQFCGQMSIQQSIIPSYHHHSNGQVGACIKFVKHTIKKYLDTN